MEKITRLGFTLLLMCIWSFANAQSDTTQVTDFTLVEQQITLRIGESCQLHVNPSDAEVKWMESWELASDPVIIVDENGLITALKAGNAVVGVESRGGSVMRYCQVAVLEEGDVRKEKKSLVPVEESEWADVGYKLTNDGTFTAQGTYYGSGAQTNYLNYITTEQCIFLWFDVNYEDSTKMFYPQPFSLEIKDCDAQKYNIYLDNRNHVLQHQDEIFKQAISRGSSISGTTNAGRISIRKDENEIYDLKGQRLNAIPKTGIYIMNGVKHLQK